MAMPPLPQIETPDVTGKYRALQQGVAAVGGGVMEYINQIGEANARKEIIKEMQQEMPEVVSVYGKHLMTMPLKDIAQGAYNVKAYKKWVEEIKKSYPDATVFDPTSIAPTIFADKEAGGLAKIMTSVESQIANAQTQAQQQKAAGVAQKIATRGQQAPAPAAAPATSPEFAAGMSTLASASKAVPPMDTETAPPPPAAPPTEAEVARQFQTFGVPVTEKTRPQFESALKMGTKPEQTDESGDIIAKFAKLKEKLQAQHPKIEVSLEELMTEGGQMGLSAKKLTSTGFQQIKSMARSQSSISNESIAKNRLSDVIDKGKKDRELQKFFGTFNMLVQNGNYQGARQLMNTRAEAAKAEADVMDSKGLAGSDKKRAEAEAWLHAAEVSKDNDRLIQEYAALGAQYMEKVSPVLAEKEKQEKEKSTDKKHRLIVTPK